MTYELLQLPHVMRQLHNLRKTHTPHLHEIIGRIQSLAKNPRPAAAQKLVGRPEWRIRIGPYRVLYQIDDRNKVITIVAVAHRREVYKGRS